MPPKKNDISYFNLSQEIKNKKFRPIYVLQGEEPYYIDKLSDLIVDNALTEDERDFNLTIVYGVDADVKQVINACKQYPVMAQRQVVVLREAQNTSKPNVSIEKELNQFKFYAQKPLDSTILVICFKGGNLKGAEFLKELKASDNGVVFTSNKVRDYELPRLVVDYVNSVYCNIDDKAASMLADFVGTDLSRLFGEIDKLILLVGTDKRITPALIERNIGISKDYNNFELEDAFSNRNAEKVYRILDYFEKNPKNNPVVVTVSMLFSFFSNLLLIRTSRDKSDKGLMAQINTQSSFRLGKLKKAANSYSTLACVNIISYLRECDVKSKGQGSRQDSYSLLRDLAYKILHS
ncbi:MAG: DNA polymerase III subunit delta [Muribaculaceae bacterium]|nr:DNA polymerase III subunit delta [Muribaculaceae bacterium]